MIIVAVMAHVWLVRAPRPVDPAAVLSAGAPLMEVPTGTSGEAAEPPGTLESVTVETRLVPVATRGVVSPAEALASRREPAAADRPQSTPAPARAAAATLTEPVHAAAATATEEPLLTLAVDDADAADVPRPAHHEGGLASGDGASDADAPLAAAPLAASRQSAIPTRISALLPKATQKAPERIITAAPIVEPDQKALVNRVLEQYAAAYGRLDAEAAKLVYPGVNESALRRAFRQLETQRLTFDSCGITISGSGANARCQGEAAYRPRVGPRSLQRASREWTFDLAKADDGWHIVKARVR